MTLDLHQLFLLGMVSATLHWLVARSLIFKPLWSRAGGWLDSLLRCPACSGFWLGLGLGALRVRPVIVHDVNWRWQLGMSIFVAGLCGLFLTPVFEAALLWGLDRAAVPDAETLEGLEGLTGDAAAERRAREILNLPG